MKKYLSAFAMITAFSIGSLYASDNQLVLESVVTAGAVVGFSDMSGESLGSGQTGTVVFRNPTNSFYFGTISAGEQFTQMTKPLYVKTNNGSGVSITIDDASNSGNLKRFGGATIIVDYKILGSDYTIGDSVNLLTTTNTGSSSIGDLEIIPRQTDAIQEAGNYGTSLDVTIALSFIGNHDEKNSSVATL